MISHFSRKIYSNSFFPRLWPRYDRVLHRELLLHVRRLHHRVRRLLADIAVKHHLLRSANAARM